MNQEQAKFILASFRPDGSDIDDLAFAEAVSLAATDKELGAWLAKERALDTFFVDSLNEIAIPENLREDLFETLAMAQEDHRGYTEFDHEFAEAFSTMQPPESLRDEILAGMQVAKTVTNLPTANSEKSRMKMPNRLLAIAAAVAITGVLVVFLKPSNPHRQLAVLTPASIQAESVDFLKRNFILDQKNSKQDELYQFLSQNELPSPEQLPAGLEAASGIGCKRLDFNNKPASLICYQQKQGGPVVHLIVFRKDDLPEETLELPTLAEAKEGCVDCDVPGWSATKWTDEKRAFFLLAKTEPFQLASLF